MKKYLLTTFAVFSALAIPSFASAAIGDSIFYINGGDGNKIYKKSASDTSNGSAINSVNSSSIAVSSDWSFIYYSNASDGNKIYKKSASDTSNGSAINSSSSLDISASSDGQFVFYRNTSDWNKLYKKSASDTSDGSPITTNGAFLASISNDWSSIIYTNLLSDSKIYKKSASDTSNGSAITSANGYYPTFSQDWNFIYYSNSSDWNKLYKKSASDTSDGIAITTSQAGWRAVESTDWLYVVYTNTSNYFLYKKSASDTSNGSAITSTNSNYPIYNWIIVASCSDGIQNQDETAIDFGGVCWSQGLEYDSLGCINQTTADLSSVVWYNDLYQSAEISFTGSEWVKPGILTTYGSGADIDRILLYDYIPELFDVDTESFDYTANNPSWFGGVIRTNTRRNWRDRPFNIIEARSATGIVKTLWSLNIWLTSANFSHTTERDGGDFSVRVPCFASWSSSFCVDTSALSYYAEAKFSWDINWLRLGYTTSTITKRSCKNKSYSCTWSPDLTECTYPYAYPIDSSPYCGIDGSWACVPIADKGVALPGQQEILDGSGNLVATEWVAPTDAQIANIFSCDRDNDLETTWQEYLTCISTVIERGVDYATRASNSAQSTVKPIQLTKTGTQTMFTSSGSATGLFGAFADKANEAVDTGNNSGRAVRFAYWFLAVLVVLIGLVLFTNARAGWK